MTAADQRLPFARRSRRRPGRPGPSPRLPAAGLLAAGLLAAALAGCDDFPKDVENTTRSVEGSGVLHAGLVADAPAEAGERALAERIAAAAHARAESETGSAEVLLHRLEQGELDLVVGRFAKASPWKGRVAFTKPASAEGSPPKQAPVLRAAVRSGENRWLLFVSDSLGRTG